MRDGPAALEALRGGRIDAAFVFRSEFRRARLPAVHQVALPDDAAVKMYLYSGVVNRGVNREGAQKLQEWLGGKDGEAALRRAGFEPEPEDFQRPEDCIADGPCRERR